MGRPQLPLGTFGAIRLYARGDTFRAVTLFRDFDGSTRQVQANGRTKAAAERAIKTALRDREYQNQGVGLTSSARLAVAAELFFAELATSDRSPSTVQAYRGRLDSQILPALGKVRLREMTPGLVDRHLNAVKAKHGNAVAKTTKTVLSGICGLACRHDAMASNPCRDVGRISTKPRRQPRALDLAEITESASGWRRTRRHGIETHPSLSTSCWPRPFG